MTSIKKKKGVNGNGGLSGHKKTKQFDVTHRVTIMWCDGTKNIVVFTSLDLLLKLEIRCLHLHVNRAASEGCHSSGWCHRLVISSSSIQG